MPLGNDAPRQAVLLANAFMQWEELKAALPPGQARAVPSSAFAYADARLMALQREALFQVQSVLKGCHRRWPELDRRATSGDAAVAN